MITEPYYKDEDVLIYRGDCLEIMPEIKKSSINLVITSPPYNAKKEYEDTLSFNEYFLFAHSWVQHIPMLLVPNGSFWLNVGYTKLGPNQTLPLTYVYYETVALPLVQEIVWHYEGGIPYKKRFTHRTDRWQWYAKDPNNVIFNLDAVRDKSLNRTKDNRNNPLGKNPTDYWYFDRVVSGNGRTEERTDHPTQFPEKMIERIILACSNKGDVILDPFVGSGTVLKVAKNLGRKAIGIEIVKEYVEIAARRVGM